jgi:hypothetical protein
LITQRSSVTCATVPFYAAQHHVYNTTTTTTTATDYFLPPANTMSLLPPPEAIYPDPNTALTAVQLHAKQHGYAFKIHDKKASRVVFACDRGGQYDSKGKDSKIRVKLAQRSAGAS